MQARRTAVDDFRQVTGLDHATSDDTARLARTAAAALAGDLDAAQQQPALINGTPRNRKDQP